MLNLTGVRNFDGHFVFEFNVRKPRMAFLSAWCGAFIWLLVAVSFAESTEVSQQILKMLQEEVPLELHFCKTLGYKKTSKVNFMKQTQQSVVKQDYRYKALKILSSSGCSDLVKPYTCAIYAPQVLKPHGALPPCRSLCTRTEKQCDWMVKFFKKGMKLYLINLL